MKCPHCNDKNLVMSERKGIEIDYCPDCRGVWLDRGELDKILERSIETAAPPEAREPSYQPPPPPSQYPTHSQPPPQYYHKPYKRKKSFFEELFD